MKNLFIIMLTLASLGVWGQTNEKKDTVATLINFGEKNMERFRQLDEQQKKIDSTINVQRNQLLDVILSAHGLDIKDVVKIEPKGKDSFIIKTKKK